MRFEIANQTYVNSYHGTRPILDSKEGIYNSFVSVTQPSQHRSGLGYLFVFIILVSVFNL